MVTRWDGLKREGWVFPARNKQSKSGHITTVQKQFQRAKEAAGIVDKRVVLYCARHTFGTVAMAESKNPAAVRDAMGHEDLDTTMTYQHQDLAVIRDVVNRRNEALARAQNRAQSETAACKL
jgi:integrase